MVEPIPTVYRASLRQPHEYAVSLDVRFFAAIPQSVHPGANQAAEE